MLPSREIVYVQHKNTLAPVKGLGYSIASIGYGLVAEPRVARGTEAYEAPVILFHYSALSTL